MKTSKVNTFIDDCISCGKCVDSSLKLSETQRIDIEFAVNRYNDTTARRILKKILVDFK